MIPGPNKADLNDLWYESFLASTVVSGQTGLVVVNPDGSSIGSGGGGGNLSAVYDTTLPTLTNGQTNPLQEDQNGRLIVTEGTLLAGEDLTNNVLGVLTKPVVGSQYDSGTYQEFGSVIAANVKTTAGNLFSFMLTSANAAIRYIQFFNTTTAPTAGATALYSFPVGAGTATQPSVLVLGTDFFVPSNYFSTGISFGISTTATTYTAATATDHTLTLNYI